MNKEKSLSIHIPGQDSRPGGADILSEAVAALTVFFSLAESFFECFRLSELGESRAFLFLPGLALILVAGAYGIFFRKGDGKANTIVPAVAAVVLILLLVVFRQEIYAGAGAYAEQFMGLRTEYTGRIQQHYSHLVMEDGSLRGIHSVSGLFSLAMAVTAILFSRSRGPAAAVAISAAFAAALLFGIAVPGAGLTAVAAALIAGSYIRRGTGGIKGFAAALKGITLPAALAVILSLLTVFTGLSGVLDTSAALDAAKELYHEARYEKRGNPLPEGRLLKAEAFEPSGRTALLVTMSEPESTYLRGFVGVNFDGSTWSGLTGSEARQQSDVFYWLHEGGFYGQSQEALAYDSAFGTGPEDMGTMTVVNMSACRKYAYVPYGLAQDGPSITDSRAIGDAAVTDPDEGPYTLSYRTAAVRNSYKLQQALAEADPEYAAAESAYRETVYASYLSIPETTEKTLEKELGPGEELSTTEAKIRAIEYLDSHVSYEAETVIRDTDDVVTVFLTEEEEGQSIHFASASAMILRHYGVPARYVEGFIIPGELADSVLPGEPIEVSEGYAHAWCEYYLDGVGWIPFESTPGYRNSNMYAGTDNMEAISDEEGGKSGYAAKKEKEDKSTDSEIDNPANRRRKVFVFRKVWIAILALAALLILLLITLIRRLRLARFRKSFRSGDPGNGLNNAFAYVVMLLSGRVPGMSTSRLAESEQGVQEIFGLGHEFRSAEQLSEKSLFSSHGVTEEERDKMVTFAETVLSRYKSSRSAAGRLADRLIRCIY